MKNILPIAFLLIIFYGIYNSIEPCGKTQKKSTQPDIDSKQVARVQKSKHNDKSPSETAYDYILHVINHGSSKLHFKKDEVMEGGYVSREDAPKVACYTLELSGEKCPYPYSKDAHLFFSSVCAGCHGNDGKGVNGAYPDLTRSVLLGLED